MQGKRHYALNVQREFNHVVAANENGQQFIKDNHKQQIYGAFGLGQVNNDWSESAFLIDEDFFCLQAFDQHSRPTRFIAVFRCPERDNDGHLFLVGTVGRKSTLQTSNFRDALTRFKRAEPELRMVSSHTI